MRFIFDSHQPKFVPRRQFSRIPVHVDDATDPGVDGLVLWTVGEVCARLSCRPSWLYDEVEAGRFPVVRLGRLLRFRPTDVAAYVEARACVPPAAGVTVAPARPNERRRPRRRKPGRSP